jgi:hypothetical protein
MADNDISWLALRGSKGVMTDDDAEPNRLPLVRGYDASRDP